MQKIVALLPASAQAWIQRDPPRAIGNSALWGVAALALLSRAPILLWLPLALLPLASSPLARLFPQLFEKYRWLRWAAPAVVAFLYTLLFFPTFFFTLLVVGYVVGYLGSFLWLVSQRGGGGGALLAAIFLFPLPIGHVLLFAGTGSKTGTVRRGSQVIPAEALQKNLAQLQKDVLAPVTPLLQIAGIEIPNSLESYGFLFTGATGSGKSQAIKAMIRTAKERGDFRIACFDRNAELLELFYEEGIDLLCNPGDARSVRWSHAAELTHVEARTLAAGLIPGAGESNPKERFFSEAARAILSVLYQRCNSNSEVWEILTTFADDELKDFFRGSLAQRYIGDRDSSGDILATLINEVAFYERIQHDSPDFSFFQWAESNDSRSIYFPLFERDLEVYKPFYSLAFDLILKGLLSNESRNVSTLILIDELGALQRLAPLSRVLAEGRKFRTTGVFGAQSVAQIQKTYGEHDFATITENVWTKLILNCEGKTAEWAAAVLGQQERVDLNRNSSSSLGSASIQAGNTSFSMPSVGGSKGVSESIRETNTVLTSELAALPPLQGYLKIKGQNPAKVQIAYQDYPKRSQRFVSAAEAKIILP